MNREKEIEAELDKYWGQLDRMERMLKWLIGAQKINLYDSGQYFLLPHDKITAVHNLPDISDILEEK